MKSYRSPTARLMAAFSQCGKQVRAISATEAQRRNVLAIARRIATLERKQRRLKANLLACRLALRFARKEFKLVTQEKEIQ